VNAAPIRIDTRSASTSDTGTTLFQAIEDVPMNLHAELGRHTIPLRKLLELKPGDVLPLPKATGENVDLYAGDVLIGSAEVLVMDGIMGIQIADLSDTPGLPQAAGI